MALAFTQQIGPILPPEVIAIVRVVLDNSYPAGGYAITPANFGLNEFSARKDRLDRIRPMLVSGGSGGGAFTLMFDIDPATGNLRAYYPTGGVGGGNPTIGDATLQVAPAAGAVAMTSTSAQPLMNGTVFPGRGKEVPAGADLSAFSVTLLAVGH